MHKKFLLFLPVLISAVVSVAHGPCFADNGQMVELSVEITEVNNTKANEMGIRWSDTVQAGEVAKTFPGQIPAAMPDVPTVFDVSDPRRFTALTAELKLLCEKGAAQVLSKPKIVARSGSAAKFLVGGEFPVVAAGPTVNTIEWKEYGIKTEMTPYVLPDNTIDLTVKTEISRLDWANKVMDYPAVATRFATSSVRVKSSQTIALAGLLETTKEDKTVGIPLLMDIPVLGYLFSHKTKQETKTNVLIFITPKILE